MITSGDVSFMTTALAQVGSYVEQTGSVFVYTSIGTSGTTAEAGHPQSVTYGTRAMSARVNRLGAAAIEQSGGKYRQNDKLFTMRGSFSADDMVSYSAGTYRPVEGPVTFYLGSNLLWQAVCREVQS